VTAAAGAMGPGTPAYMSPEQARGLQADRRTDIWSLGCVLYELLTGRRPFAGDRVSDVIAHVLEREPDFSRLPSDTPDAVRRLLRRCLEKDPASRLRDAGDARLELEEALTGVEDVARAPVSPRTSTPARWVLVAGVLGAVMLLGVMLRQREPHAPPESMRFSILPPPGGLFLTPILTGGGAPVGGTVSPDGRTLAYTATDASGKVLLWIRRLDSLEATPLAGTEGAALPFWSPDSRSLGFFGASNLKRIDIYTGAVQVLCAVTRGRGGSWHRDGVIVFSASDRSAISRISATGGDPQPLTTLEPGQLSHRFPSFLPDGRRFLYYLQNETTGNGGTFVGDLDGAPSRRVLASDSAAVYAPPAHVVFVRQGTLFAQRFDASRLAVAGDPVSLAGGVSSEGAAPAFSVSATGILTYRTGSGEEQQYAWFDRTGRLIEAVGPPGNYRGVDLSPDGQRMAVHRHDGDGGDIWVFDPRGTTTRVTFDPSQDNLSPIWSPDGRRIAFGSWRNGKWGIYEKQAEATEEDHLLTESELPKLPAAWSPDGRSIVYWLHNPRATFFDMWLLPRSGDMRPQPLISTRFYEGHAQVSPDGRWLAYVSNENGIMQVYVRSFPSGDRVWPVSTGAGVTPRWGRNGKELFYVTSYDHGTLMTIPVRREADRFEPGAPRALFDTGIVTPPHSTTIPMYHTYAVAPDGQRFLIPRPVSMLRESTPTPITVVVNWQAMLER
jgi:eukaryotic-like serine/threonine-protein kinase